MPVTLRAESDADAQWILNLIRQTIADELGASGWPEPVRSQVIEIQLANRELRTAPENESWVIEKDGNAAGWLLLTRLPHEIRLVEIMIARELRGRGIGSSAIREVRARAEVPVGLKVNVTNDAALRLYERLGFQIVLCGDVQHAMEFRRQS